MGFARRTLLTAGALMAVLAGPAAAQVPSVPGVPDLDDLTSPGHLFAASNDPGVERQALSIDTLQDPTAFAVTRDGRVIVVEREGAVKVWHQDSPDLTTIADLEVDAYDRQGGQYDPSLCPNCPDNNLAEGGIHGILLAPDFEATGDLYLYYSPAGRWNPVDGGPEVLDPPKMPGARGTAFEETVFVLARFNLSGDGSDAAPYVLAHEEELFQNPAEVAHCCHYGGDLEWSPEGYLLVSTGDDTSSDDSGAYSPHDQRPDQTWNNADLSSHNLADRRGKILRIDVRGVDGDGDDIPDGNPFLDVEGADPYVYAYGFRSPWKFGVHPVHGQVYVGNVGPDAQLPDPRRGPAAHDELEVVPPGGGTDHGWPRCIANNLAYVEYDFVSGRSTNMPFDCSGATPAAVWYTYYQSPTSPYPQLGFSTGGNTVIGGLVYDRPATGALRLPEHFDDQLLWGEFGRNTLWRMPVNPDGSLDNDTTDLHGWQTGLRRIADLEIGPDGALYLLEYGTGFWNSTNGLISRMACAGCAPDAADYGGDVVPLVAADEVRLASFGGSGGGGLMVAALVTAAVVVRGLSRRRTVV